MVIRLLSVVPRILLLLALAGSGGWFPSAKAAETVTPGEPVDLLGGDLSKTFVQHLHEKASLERAFDQVWKRLDDGTLEITGKGFGYLRTHESFRDYHLVVEYQWTERTFAGRENRARDGGVLFHITGNDGAFGGTWPACLQAQLIEGGSGDLVALPTDAVDSRFTAAALVQEVPTWSPDGKQHDFPLSGKKTAHLGWRDRSENWKDVRGFRGELDIENPPGEWNRLEVIADGTRVEIRLNGETVNRASDIHPSSGAIGLQTEFAAYRVRRMELFPLGQFEEEWRATEGSTDMGYSITGESILPRRFPLPPEESRRRWEIDGPFEIELVAAEPLTRDPVDVAWDTEGRLFVAEMGDYPLPADDGPYLSRIRLLHDENGDGIMDAATTWADDLDHVQGLLPMRDGLLATTRTAILFLRDSDGDDVADEREVLFRSNEPRHNQLQVSSPRWGLDNRIYFSNGLDGKQIYPADDPDSVTEFTRLNLRYDPASGAIEPVTGIGQYGGSIDAFGRHFFCSNRNPAMFAVMPLKAVRRNPLAGIRFGHEDIQPQAAPVRPIALSHTTSAAHAGTHTAACGIAIYTGDAVPGLTGDLFVCDPTAQLVTRNRLVPNGASFIAERVGDDREFLASGDEWARPVQLRNGPDGALYVVDMYRRFIDHSRFFPEEFAKDHYMRAGLDHGRIWRIVPKGEDARPVEPLPESTPELVSRLSHPNDWTRRHAQRRLVERREQSAIPVVTDLLETASTPEAFVRALWTLHGLGALTGERLELAYETLVPAALENALLATPESELEGVIEKQVGELTFAHELPRVQLLSLCLFPEVERDSVALAEIVFREPTHSWVRKAILSSEGEQAPAILARLLSPEPLGKLPPFTSLPPATAAAAISDFSRHTAALGNLEALGEAIALLEGEPAWWHFEVVSGISEGLRQSSLEQKSLAALIAAEPTELGDGVQTLENLLESATRIALDRERADSDRTAALELVAQRPLDEKLALVEQLIELTEAPAIQAAACRMLARGDREKVAEFFFDRWGDLAPTPRREALALITSNTRTGLLLMKKMEAGEISSSIMPPMTRWSYGRSSNEEIQALAKKLFGQVDENRAEVLSRYRTEIANLEGDATRGREVFAKAACITCHEFSGEGVAVGPPLADIRAKPVEAILTDILDPNRAVEERWVGSTVQTTGGDTLSGIVAAEDGASLHLRMPGGSEVRVAREEVASIQSSGLSLMPVGLEAAISPSEMADLIAYLKHRP